RQPGPTLPPTQDLDNTNAPPPQDPQGLFQDHAVRSNTGFKSICHPDTTPKSEEPDNHEEEATASKTPCSQQRSQLPDTTPTPEPTTNKNATNTNDTTQP
ncbi:MAG: hypothetical protein OXI96_01960, partial [Acidimicrobiaceae bacterium]|nr:hypothetical protein [Acidimicrobiaceae bacterium]